MHPGVVGLLLVDVCGLPVNRKLGLGREVRAREQGDAGAEGFAGKGAGLTHGGEHPVFAEPVVVAGAGFQSIGFHFHRPVAGGIGCEGAAVCDSAGRKIFAGRHFPVHGCTAGGRALGIQSRPEND